uniref:Interleukin 17-like protein n=1 Tax=Strongyloides papillosus TaxID=174720 RepID=A0A0N5BZF5_STREA
MVIIMIFLSKNIFNEIYQNWIAVYFLVFSTFSLIGGKMQSEIRLSDECYYRYTAQDHHKSFSDWLHRKNSSHYSPLVPSYSQALLKLEMDKFKHGEQVTSGASACNGRQNSFITPETPLRERALCKFEYIVNYNPKRLPSTLTEARCSCSRPSAKVIGKKVFECEPLRYSMRVLLFDNDCQSFYEGYETIALACIPVMQASASSSVDTDFMVPVKADIPT